MKFKNSVVFLFFFSLIFFTRLSFLSAEGVNKFIIVPPEFADESGSSFSPPDEQLLINNMQDEIYSVFSHYSSGNAEKRKDADAQYSKNTRIIRSFVNLSAITESEKGFFFCETELVLFEKDTETSVSLKYTASGKTEDEAFHKSLSKLSEQIKYSFSEFDEKGGFYRILDIYQNEIIVSCGKNEGFSKGDYLEILNSSTGRPEGRIILTASDDELSYGRLLDWNPEDRKLKRPSPGSKVRKIKYIGLDASVSSEFLFDDIFSGSGINFKLEYFRSFYIFHPFVSASLYNIESSTETYDLDLLSLGLAMLRHFGKISLRSEVSLTRACYKELFGDPADFKGGRVRAGVEYSVLRHLGLFAEAGFMQLFAEDEADPDIGGFLFSGGLSFKY